MAGHLFIVRGDLTRLACDAWLLPTGYKLRVEDYWLTPEPKGFLKAVSGMLPSLSPKWASGEQRVLPAPLWHKDRSRPWLVNIIGQRGPQLGETVEFFIREFLKKKMPPANDRERPLLALPVISTGKGGGARVKGRVINNLVQSLLELVKRYDVDLVLVTHTAAALAAAQKARFEAGENWSELSAQLSKKARAMAAAGRKDGLALFLGAGVSCSAGLPSWNGLLENLAVELGIKDSELKEFNRLDVLDRGSILQRRFSAAGKSMNETVAAVFQRTWDHSLLHGLLACLPAAEVITQNYDRLFEVAADGAGMPVSALPYTPGEVHNRWLLKMHGCVSVPDDIVIRREDYLRYSERRAALSGIVQATLLTRRMLFVGFSLRDGNFHRAVDDVRRAISHRMRKRLGTALFLAPSFLTAELWDSELDIIDFGANSNIAPAARRLEIFLDCLLAHCGSNTDHLLDPTFTHLLSKPEAKLRKALLKLPEGLPDECRKTAAWAKVRELLTSLGWED